MPNNQHRQGAQSKRRCAACNQLRPLDNYGMHNGYRRRTCWTCRAVRTFRRAEEKFAGLLRQIARLGRQDRLRSHEATETLNELVQLSGSPHALAKRLKRQLDEAIRTQPDQKNTVDLLCMVIQLTIAAAKATEGRR